MTVSMEIKPGFRDPVLDSQTVFRAVMDAMSRPGRLYSASAIEDAPAPLHPATAALCVTLVDHDTPLWVTPELRSETALAFLRFHCGCPIVDAPGEAAFALAEAGTVPALSAFAPGNDAYPETSTTVIVQTAGLKAEGGNLTLKGPGIETTHTLSAAGLRDGLWDEWRENAFLFPCGVDLILVHGRTVAALPRTTTVEAGSAETDAKEG